MLGRITQVNIVFNRLNSTETHNSKSAALDSGLAGLEAAHTNLGLFSKDHGHKKHKEWMKRVPLAPVQRLLITRRPRFPK